MSLSEPSEPSILMQLSYPIYSRKETIVKQLLNMQGFLHGISQWLSREPEFSTHGKRPALPVASILRDLDEIFSLGLNAVGQIISSGNTTPREEIIASMMEWAKGPNSEFEETKYFKRLVVLAEIAQIITDHPQFEGNLEQALTLPLPSNLDESQRSIAHYIQADDFAAIKKIIKKLEKS